MYWYVLCIVRYRFHPLRRFSCDVPTARGVPGFLPVLESAGLRHPRRGTAAGDRSVQLPPAGPGGRSAPLYIIINLIQFFISRESNGQIPDSSETVDLRKICHVWFIHHTSYFKKYI